MGVKLKGTRRGNGLNRYCDALEEVLGLRLVLCHTG